MKPQRVYGQMSWKLQSDRVCAWLTQSGGHLGPVEFRLGRRVVAPYSVAPWWNEKLPGSVPVILRVLRGDFFCAPFGANTEAYRGERHPLHGETANGRWQLIESNGQRLHARLRTRVRTGQVDKLIELRDGHTAVYQRHRLVGMGGPMPVGHHAMLRFNSPGKITTSRFVFGQVCPVPFENPAEGGYSTLKVGAEFDSLERVPLATGDYTDLSRYPARRGFEDLAMIVADDSQPLAWTAVTFPQERFVWFALKDPRTLRETLFWISNGGRHQPLWEGRHVNVMGLEEVTSYFAFGLAASARPNPLSARGFPTCLHLNRHRPTVVSYIMAVAEVPRGFDEVARIEAVNGGVELVSPKGARVRVALDWEFLRREV
ncbi:MAG: hypothetical protein NZ483_04950 [Verrucomicrobiae bacterium]|nr:hypothetical protein [Verrucomicrobiae bacterium]MDW8344007.1 hypothetical protein [Verrucomicrobiae bacterium]